MARVQVIQGVILCDITLFHNFSLNEYFHKSIVGLHYLAILPMLAKYQDVRSWIKSY